ncbi:hypothetical protein [Ornithinibacillus bavariensis]|uniref:Nucleotide kinase n=1 Tax=Ornithinibacillus bavariensis TaxID=545502 RepID=A0A920C586_9BACI|nr:hypothetical protein [Ornithinibacillus bavariensis]GIO26455.1 hypothetical protein J43TS3_10660 [Ornithinibacillus bavariensis]
MPNKQGYYVSGNTAEGFVNFLSSNTSNFHHHIILKHPSYTIKTAIMQEIICEYENDFTIEVLYSSVGKEFLEGVIIRDKKLAVIDERIAIPNLNGAFELDLTLFFAQDLSTNISEENTEIIRLTQQAYNHFATGLSIHDDLETVYIQEMDFTKADTLFTNFITSLLGEVPKKEDKKPTITKRLFGTNTKDGVVNVVPEILKQLNTKYFLKGRAGTGKSTFMKKVMEACHEHGYDVELYHCSFDPKSVDMVLVRDLSFCIFDSTDPHEFFPKSSNEIIIDIYEEAVTPGTDEKYAYEIENLNSRYKSFMKKGIQELKQAGEIIQKVEEQFIVDSREIEKVKSFILGRILV